MDSTNCETFFECNDGLSIEQVLKTMIIDDGNGCPVLKVKDINSQGNVLMEDLTPALIESAEAVGSKTLAGLYTAFTTWKTANASKTAFFIPVMGGDGIPGIIALSK